MAQSGEGRKLCVLLVDANADVLRLLAALLVKYGHDLYVAITAEDALRQAAVVRPEVIFTGLTLPDSSGYDLVREFRAKPESMNAFIVALEGYCDHHQGAHYKAAGFDHCLSKPITIDEIVRITMFLSKHYSVAGTPRVPK